MTLKINNPSINKIYTRFKKNNKKTVNYINKKITNNTNSSSNNNYNNNTKQILTWYR